MKKLLTLALAASMLLALSINSFALGNYVLATDELGTAEEEPIPEEDTELEPVPDTEVTPEPDTEQPTPVDKVNPDTGAEPSNALLFSHGCPAAFNFICTSRNVKSSATPKPAIARAQRSSLACFSGAPIRTASSVS